MEQYKCTVADLDYYDNEKPVLIEVNEDSDEIEISTVVDGIDFFSSDESYLAAYQKLRDKLLELGYGLLCNGSRINAIQSGMMSQCEKIYLVEMGKKVLLICYYRCNIEKMLDTINIPVIKITTEMLRKYLVEYQTINNCGKVTIDNIRRSLSTFFFRG